MTAALITLAALGAAVAVVLLLDRASSRRQQRRLAAGHPRAGHDTRNRDLSTNQAVVESSARNARDATYGI